MEKVDNMKKRLRNVNREMETLWQNQKERLEIKTSATEMEYAFDGLFARREIAEERISDGEDMSIETSQTKIEEEESKIKTKQKQNIT